MISKGANDWSSGLYCACKGGNKEIAILMNKKGATKTWNGEIYSDDKEPREYFKVKFGEYPPN